MNRRKLIRFHFILGQAFIHDIRPGPVLFVYAVAFTLVVHHH